MKRKVEANNQRTTVRLCILAILFLLFISLLIFWNASGLFQAIQHHTQHYLEDVSRQTAQLIDARLENINNSLQMIAHSAAELEPGGRTAYLQRIRDIASFHDLLITGTDGHAVFSDGSSDDLSSLPAFQTALGGDHAACVYQDKYILYLLPLEEAQTVTGVIVGVKSKAMMEKFINNDCFDSEGSICLLDQNGKYVVSPIQRDFSLLIAESTYSETDDWAVEMLHNIQSGQPGSLVLPTKSGTDILLDYRPLNAYGWIIVTMVPQNMLTADVTNFVNQTFFIVLILAALFAVLFIVIIAMQIRYRAKLENIVFFDAVTGGNSSMRFRMLAEETIRKKHPGAYVLVAINLKQFKLLNETAGSKRGDQVLRLVYQTLEGMLRGPDEIVAHGEADNFYLLLKNEAPEILHGRLQNIMETLGTLDGAAGSLRVSMGVYTIDSSPADLIVCRDRANIARDSGSGSYNSTCVFYDQAIIDQQREEFALIELLGQAFDREEFLVYLQPKVRLSDNRIVGAEALVRWNQPDRGIISPAAFIPLCEKNDMIRRLDLYMFERVCRLLQTWKRDGRTILPISVNLSRQHLRNRDFLNHYLEILSRYDVPPEWIEFELTESIMFSESDVLKAKNIIQEIHHNGFRCSMDDFGSGYSALGLLKELPIDCLKLDRQFFTDDLENARAQAVVTAIVQLAGKLKIEVVAEGVEQEPQVRFLREIGCDVVQGYVFSPPLPLEEFESLLDAGETL